MHQYEDNELDKDFSTETLKNLETIWKRPVHIQTKLEDKEIILSFDGKDYKQNWISEN